LERWAREAPLRALRIRRFEIGEHWPVLVFIALLIILIVLKGRFTPFDLRSLCVNALPLAFIALGQFLVVLTRGVDLSLGPVASVAGAVMALTISTHPVLGIALPILIGLIAGLANAIFAARLGLPPIIVTLATMSIWQGIALVVLPDPGGSVPADFQAAITGGFSMPLAGILGIATCCIGGTWLLSSRFGLHLRAIGGDEQAARMSGVRVRQVKSLAYVVAGMLAALGGMYLATATASGSPTVGDSYILTSIAAVVIGGVPLSGGRGTAIGVVMGALILTITSSLLYFSDISSFYQSIIDGVILLTIVGSGAAHGWFRSISTVRA
jgi:ribose transport system permease protein